MTLEQQILAYAEQQAPREMCGFVVFKGQEKIFIPCENIAADTENYFEISADDYLTAHQYDGIVALVHSHPSGEPVLSAADRQMQVQSDLDWWLVCNDEIKRFKNRPHLLGREFIHAVQDCYTLFRDAYMLAGLELPAFEYAQEWYKQGDNYYMENLPKHGFSIIDNGPRLGDVILMRVDSPVPNHVGIYLGNQQVLHHSPQRLSKRDFYDGYWFKHTHSIWRYDAWQQLNFTGILNDLAVNLTSI